MPFEFLGKILTQLILVALVIPEQSDLPPPLFPTSFSCPVVVTSPLCGGVSSHVPLYNGSASLPCSSRLLCLSS